MLALSGDAPSSSAPAHTGLVRRPFVATIASRSVNTDGPYAAAETFGSWTTNCMRGFTRGLHSVTFAVAGRVMLGVTMLVLLLSAGSVMLLVVKMVVGLTGTTVAAPAFCPSTVKVMVRLPGVLATKE